MAYRPSTAPQSPASRPLAPVIADNKREPDFRMKSGSLLFFQLLFGFLRLLAAFIGFEDALANAI